MLLTAVFLSSVTLPAICKESQPPQVSPLRNQSALLQEKKTVSEKKTVAATLRQRGQIHRKPVEKAVTQTSTAGIVELPYFNNIDDKTNFNDFTVIDANGDGTTWAWSAKSARISYGDGDMDDWLIMPAMQLEGGKAYKFEFDVRGNSSSFTERFELKMGTAAEAEAMSTTLVEPTDIETGDWIHRSVDIMPDIDGVYYIGIHGISTEMDGFYLYINDVSMSAPQSTTAPSAVTNLTAIPGADGALSATINFKAPATLINGEAANSLTKIELSEGETMLATLDAPEPGKEYSVPVTLETEGDHTFAVVAYNTDGAGAPAEVSAYIGINYPAAPGNVTINETDNYGEVTVSWDAVTEDQEGFPLSAAQITYSVYSLNGDAPELVGEGLTDTSLTVRAVAEEGQDIVQYAVFASTKRGVGKGTTTPAIFAGKPYEEFAESFADGALSHPLAIMTWSEHEATWLIQDDGSMDNVTSQDDDNGFILMNGRMADIHSALGLGKISLAGKTSPAVVFYTLGLDDGEGNPDINVVEVWVKEKGASGFVNIFSKTVDELAAPDEWGRVAVDLSAYAGKEIELAIGGIIKFYVNILLDNITLTELNGHDLSVYLTGPARMTNQTDFNLVAKVRNLGKETSGEYSVRLMADGKEIGSFTADALEANGTKEFEFTHKFQAIQHDAVAFTAEVIYEADEVADNNISSEVSVQPKESLLPAVTDLSGAVTEEGVALSWSQPDLSTGATAYTELFENGQAGDKTYGDWTFVDVDNVPVSGFRGVEIPGITNNESTASFFLFDGTLPQLNETFAAHSGKQYLASLARYDFKEVDDWAISPELTGSAQTVSFFAKSYDPRYLENIEVYYSTGSTDPADFTPVLERTVVTSDWREYSADLPAGAKRFAIRSCAEDAMMLMVDDVTYEISLSAEALSLTGYNVYRNNELITSSPVKECAYTDTGAEGETTWLVTAVYETGESGRSNEVELSVSGISDIKDNVRINVSDGMMHITGAAGLKVNVSGLDGTVVFDGNAGSDILHISVVPGVYVGNVGNRIFKVIVK